MTKKTLLLCFAVSAIAALGAANQEPKQPPQEPAAAPPASDPAVHVHRADTLAGLMVKGAGDQEIGKLECLVIDSSNGQIAYAMVGSGGMLGLGVRHRLVPVLALRFSEKRAKDRMVCEVVALLTPEQVAACPSLERGEEITAEHEKKALDAAKLPADANLGHRAASLLVSTLELEGCSVHAKPQIPIGKIARVLVDPIESRVAYLVLDVKGAPGFTEKLAAIPWQAAQLKLDKHGKLVLETPLTKESLDAAPTYVEKDWKQMTSPAWIRDLATSYDVEPYWVRATLARSNPIRKRD